MSIVVQVGEERRDYSSGLESWVAEQLHRRRLDGANTCVRVIIQSGSINITLMTPGCASRSGPSRRANHREEQLFDLWRDCGLDDAGFQPSHIVTFLRQISQHL